MLRVTRCERARAAARPAVAAFALAAFALIGFAPAGCASHVPYEISEADKAKYLAFAQIPPKAPGNAPQIFGITDCTLYKAVTEDERIVDWRVVLSSDWGEHSYPKWMTACAREALRYDGKYVHVLFCAQAIGAGGGCAGGGGSYRSRDGEHHWEVSQDQQSWYPLPE